MEDVFTKVCVTLILLGGISILAAGIYAISSFIIQFWRA